MSKRIHFTDEQRAAMRLVEGLINDGTLILAPDRWSVGRMMFKQADRTESRPILANDLGQTACQVLGLDPSKITSITIRMEANTAACVEVVRTINRTEGDQITGALEIYDLTRRGM